MSATITRDEARARAELLTVHSYQIDLDLSQPSAETFGSQTVVRFSCASPGEGSWIDLIAAEVRSAELNGQRLDVDGYDGARLAVGPLAAENTLRLHARTSFMSTGEGLHRLEDPADGSIYVYTQLATAEARRVFACFEQPDLKARFSLRVTAPERWVVRSNTRCPGPEPAGPGCCTWTFPETAPLPTYLAALCGGPFHIVESAFDGAHGTYPMALLVRASAAGNLDAEEIFAITRAGLAQYEQQFSRPYPFASYDQVAMPEFNFGAMENPGLVIFHEDLLLFRSRVTQAARELRAVVICHEMAHMWFGNLVTMSWWDDLWLNESFAEWSGYQVTALATEHREAWTSFAQARKAWAYQADQQPSTHPVAADTPDLAAVYLNFDGITYAKGASVVKQLVAYVGMEAFLAGLDRYFGTHEWGNARLADLLAALEEASGRDLHHWSRQWLEQPGVTVLRPVIALDDRGRYARVAVEQLAPTRPAGIPGVLRPHRIAVGLYSWAGQPRQLQRVHRVEVDVSGASTEVPELVGVPAADLVLVNDDDLTYAKVRFDPASQRTALGAVGDLADSLPRALVWCALWEQVRDGELAAQEFVAAALRGLVAESRPSIIETVLAQARLATFRYMPEQVRAEWAEQLCEGTAALLDAAPPGSDRQLALATGHLAVVSPGRVDRLRALADGSASIDGLPLDDDLRWAALTRMAVLGALDLGPIESELAADRTSKGQRMAARARAAIPTAQAKDLAWSAAVGGQLSNAVLAGTVAGFSDDSTPADVLAPYRDRYFEQIADLWAARSPAESQVLARGLFPAIDPATVVAADRFLAGDAVAPGLRRIVVEGRAEAQLALRAREVSRNAARGLGTG